MRRSARAGTRRGRRADLRTRVRPCQPCSMPNGSGTSEPPFGTGSGNASACTCPVSCGSALLRSRARLPLACSAAAVRSNVSAAIRPARGCQVRHQRQRTIAQPGGQTRQARRSGRPASHQPARARMAHRQRPLHSPDRRSMVGLPPTAASARASRASMASASCGPAACTSSLAGPCQSAGVARQEFGSIVRQLQSHPASRG